MDIADGTILGKKVAVPSVKNYVRAAAEFATDDNYPDPRYRYDFNGNRIGGTGEYFPALKALYNMMEKWKKEKAEGLPLTLDMLKALIIRAKSTHIHSELGCIRDSTLLGIYTGSRCSEYCKGKGSPFSRVPETPQTIDSFANWPIAFTVEDFQFLSENLTVIHWSKVNPSKTKVQIRFRYDKGGKCNFSKRTFAAVNTKDEILQYFCPVRTCLRIISRWQAINGNKLTPVFCHINSQGSMQYLADQRINICYRELVEELYPDQAHLFRLRVKDFRTHSVRITACLLLTASGLPEHVIEFKLRWASNAWKTYLREHLDTIQLQTDMVFRQAISTGSLQNAKPESDTRFEEPPFDSSTDDGN